MTSFNLDYLLKALSPNIIAMGFRASMHGWRWSIIYFIANLFLFFFPAAFAAYGISQARGRIELQLGHNYATATATPDPSHICDPCHSLRQCQILNPMSEARDRIHILLETILNSFSFFFRAAPTAYGDSQARGLIEAIATGLHHSTTRSEPHL